MEGVAGPKQLRRLLEAVMSIGSDLDLGSVLRRLVEVAVDLVNARYGALGVLDQTGTRLSEFITVGLTDEQRDAIGHLPEGHGLLGLLIVDPRPLRLPMIHDHEESYGFPLGHPPMQSFLGVPILVRERVFGNLYLTDKADGDVFTDVDEEMVVALAAAAGVAIDNARLHGRVGELATFADRERIARDLHDTVIQRLFAIGLTLEGVLPRVAPDVGDRVAKAVDDIDETIRRIRAAIFELEVARGGAATLCGRVLEACARARDTLGFDPEVSFDGPLDSIVDQPVVEHLLAVLDETLMNVAQHAGATRVEVHVAATVDPPSVRLAVADNGGGVTLRAAGDHEGRGLRNMSARAQGLGGSFTLAPRAGGGMVAVWEVPLTP